MSASLAAMRATGAPTTPDSPSWVIMAAKNPSSKASTSISALSDSTTIMASPASIESPSALSHETTFPSFMVDDKAGISIWLNSQSGTAPEEVAAAGAATSAAGAGAAPPEKLAMTESMSDSDSAIKATASPTGAISPSPTMILAKKPSSKASTSMSALSDSTTMMASPASIESPSDLSQDTTLPSFMVEDSAGMVILVPSALSCVDTAWRGSTLVANGAKASVDTLMASIIRQARENFIVLSCGVLKE
mmetsp:Transcript_24212/g.46091  ORF Transcript_24212/g.46091 Transcript_24212/m.46091 type:complete len:249 (+) Transcript_24212:226-972(+)